MGLPIAMPANWKAPCRIDKELSQTKGLAIGGGCQLTLVSAAPNSFVEQGRNDCEAFDLLQALNTGHSGTLSTIHANSAEQALARFSSCVVQSGVELPYQTVRYQIADAIDLVLHLGRTQGARVVRQLIRINRYDAERDRYNADALFSQDEVEQRRGSGSSSNAAGSH